MLRYLKTRKTTTLIKIKNIMVKEFKTRTGAIYCDTERRMEYLYVGDYGKENNIKADFLGYKNEINQVPHHEVDLKDKMVVTISTQKGCPMRCMFCDCPKVKFGGNISRGELYLEVANAIDFSGCKHTERFNLHLARMGEPSFNADNVFAFLKEDLREMVNSRMKLMLSIQCSLRCARRVLAKRRCWTSSSGSVPSRTRTTTVRLVCNCQSIPPMRNRGICCSEDVH